MKEIKISSTKYPGKIALVDDEDYEYLNQWNWMLAVQPKTSYAVAWINNKSIKMHRLIMKVNGHKNIVDHKNRNGLDNQKHNLRICTHSQNNSNRIKRKECTSKYLGVHKGYKNRYVVCSCKDGKSVYGGTYDNESDAALSYNKLALSLHGEFDRLNIIIH